MRRAALLYGCLLVAGCVSTHPNYPPRWQIGTPAASGAVAPGTVYLQHESKQAEDGNTYTIQFFAITNVASVAPGDPYRTDIAANRWPVKRSHVDLSLDGGQTWPRRIGYGIPVDSGRTYGEFVWSPPLDWGLLTTNAVMRVTDLDGNCFPARTNPAPYDLPEGQYVKSAPFVIAGIHVLTPTNGQITWASTPTTVRWRSAGAGTTMRVYWITPNTVTNWPNQCLGTYTNIDLVEQTNSIAMPAQTAPEVRLLLIGTNDINLHGYSGTISVE